jgi:uncharacterized repeat protein (TIGR04138 family)
MLCYGLDPAKLSEEAAALHRCLEADGVAEALGYSLDAVFFVLAVLAKEGAGPAPEGAEPRKRHMTGRELCERICAAVRQMYGPHAFDALFFLRLRRGEDVGRIVEALIERGHVIAGPGDSLRDFEGISLLSVVRPGGA